MESKSQTQEQISHLLELNGLELNKGTTEEGKRTLKTLKSRFESVSFN
jgi:hypothetical protein